MKKSISLKVLVVCVMAILCSCKAQNGLRVGNGKITPSAVVTRGDGMIGNSILLSEQALLAPASKISQVILADASLLLKVNNPSATNLADVKLDLADVPQIVAAKGDDLLQQSLSLQDCTMTFSLDTCVTEANALIK